jgi:Ca-activated chloride channel homolog
MWNRHDVRSSRGWRSVVAASLAILLAVWPLAGCRTSNRAPDKSVVVVGGVTPGAPVGEVSGYVTHEGAPLPGATITISSSKLRGIRSAVSYVGSAVSYVGGGFAFKALPPGAYAVRVELEGLQPATYAVEVVAGGDTRVTASLHFSSIAEAITVTAAAPSGLESSMFAMATQETTSRARRPAPAPAPIVTRPTTYLESTRNATRAARPVPDKGFCCENYLTVEEVPFRRASEEPISTFAIDTDRASYANARRFIEFGSLPPTDAVRVEEMINYFEYAYPEPADGRPFVIATEIADCPWSASHKLLRVGVQGKRIEPASLPPSNLVFLVDVSGSMGSADKLPLVRESLKKLATKLRPEDRVAIVVYAGASGLVLPSTSGGETWAIVQAIDSLRPGGSTAGAEGILLAYAIARDNYLPEGNNRVILATDGDFNVGPSSVAELQRLIEAKRGEGVFLSVLGVGAGNLNDAMMETLADKGNGQYSYLDSLAEAEKVLVREMAGTLLTIAKDVKIQVEFNPSRVGAYRLIGYDNRVLAREDFDDDAKDAGELGAGHSVTALYELVPPGGEREAGATGEALEEVPADERAAWDGEQLAHVRLRYKEPRAEVSALVEAVVEDSNRSVWAASEDFRFAVAVAQFGLLLRESEYRGLASWKSVIDLASSASALDVEGDRAGFVALARKAEGLATQKVARGR